MTIEERIHAEIECENEEALKSKELESECEDEIEESVNDLIEDVLDKYQQKGMNVRAYLNSGIELPLNRVFERWVA